jgi:SAM-dependent methyltransferase
MDLRIYERLSRVYDLDWSDFSLQYVNLIEALLKEVGVQHAALLDLACGTGSLLIELVKRGHTGLGIDSSPEMIERARRKTGELHNISFGVQDMTCLQLDQQFDLITCTFDSLNYITRIESIERMFHTVVLHLRSPGLFVFDSNTRHQYQNNGDFARAYELDGIRFIQRTRYDAPNHMAITVFEFTDGCREVHMQRPYDLTELKPILRKAGLKAVKTHGNFRGKRYNSRSERLICIASKR